MGHGLVQVFGASGNDWEAMRKLEDSLMDAKAMAESELAYALLNAGVNPERIAVETSGRDALKIATGFRNALQMRMQQMTGVKHQETNDRHFGEHVAGLEANSSVVQWWVHAVLYWGGE